MIAYTKANQLEKIKLRCICNSADQKPCIKSAYKLIKMLVLQLNKASVQGGVIIDIRQ